MPGPPPKPTALKKLAGNPGKRPLPENEPQPDRIMPAMPRGLPKRAQKFWRSLADKLDRLGLLTEVDGPAFTLMAIHYAVAWEAMEIIQRDVLVLADESGAPEKVIRQAGLLTVDENGAARKHPLLQVWRENSAAFLRYAVQFGLTPSARTRLSMPEPPSEDEFFGF